MFREQPAGTYTAPRFSASRKMGSYIGFLLFTWAMFQGSTLHVSAQTMITGAQIRNPFIPVSVLPATCTPYSVYFLTTTNTPYICTSTNTLTPFSTTQGSGSGLPSPAGIPGYLYTDGANLLWGNMITGGSGALDCTTTPGQCDIVTSIVPLLPSANTWTGANDFSGSAWTKPFMSASSAPSSPQEGQAYYDTTAHTPFFYNGTAFTAFGGASQTTGQTTITNGTIEPFGKAYQYGSVATAVTLTTTAQTYDFTTYAPVQMSGIAVYLNGATQVSTCSGGSGPCGTVFAIVTPDQSTIECQTQAGYPGAPDNGNTGTSGVKMLAVSSGSTYTGGHCVLPAGGHVFVESVENGTGIGLVGSYGTDFHWNVDGAINAFYFGYTTSPITTGTGSTYQLQSLASATFTALSGNTGATSPYVKLY